MANDIELVKDNHGFPAILMNATAIVLLHVTADTLNVNGNNHIAILHRTTHESVSFSQIRGRRHNIVTIFRIIKTSGYYNIA